MFQKVCTDCSPARRTCLLLQGVLEAEEETENQDEKEWVASGLFVRIDFGMAQHSGFDNPDDVALQVQQSHACLEQLLQQQPDFKGKEDGCRNHSTKQVWKQFVDAHDPR
jgi:hypothetical protein